MPRIDDTARVAAAITAQLDTGERVLLATAMQLTSGPDRSLRLPRRTAADERGALRRGAEGTAMVVASLATNNSPFNFRGPDIDRWLNGVGITGPAGSIAQSTAGLLRSTNRTYLVLTDRRILVVVDRRGLHVSGALERAALRGAQRKPKLFFRGRIVLTFVDGSTLALQTNPPFGPSPADRFVEVASGRG